MISTNLLDNDSAAEGLPMRLVVTVILLSVIIGLSAKAATLFIDDANEKKLKGQLDLIDKRASVLYIQGGAQDIDDPADFSGTMENIHVEIPDNAAFVVFGAMPSPDGNPPGAGNLHTDNVFYYVPVSYTHLRAHETRHDLVCRLLLEKKKKKIIKCKKKKKKKTKKTKVKKRKKKK